MTQYKRFIINSMNEISEEIRIDLLKEWKLGRCINQIKEDIHHVQFYDGYHYIKCLYESSLSNFEDSLYIHISMRVSEPGYEKVEEIYDFIEEAGELQ